MTSFGTVGGKWENGAAPRDASPGGRLPLTSDTTRREGRAMMPDPNSPTSATPRATGDEDLLYAAAVRLLAADRLAELIGDDNARAYVLGLANAYGVGMSDAQAILGLDIHQARRAMVTGQVPA